MSLLEHYLAIANCRDILVLIWSHCKSINIYENHGTHCEVWRLETQLANCKWSFTWSHTLDCWLVYFPCCSGKLTAASTWTDSTEWVHWNYELFWITLNFVQMPWGLILLTLCLYANLQTENNGFLILILFDFSFQGILYLDLYIYKETLDYYD